MAKAQLISISHPKHHQTLTRIMLRGGIVGTLWGHHLYFLACNACDIKAVKRMNIIKDRSPDQVFVSPGAVEEVQEFADIKRSRGLINASKKKGMKPLEYIEFLFKKFPLGVELYANDKVPDSVAFVTKNGKTIWIAGHMADKNYSKLLEAVRNLRRAGKNMVFAGTSLNLKGYNTLTVRQFDKVIKDFSDKVDVISVHPNADSLKRVRYATSCSVISFIDKRPQILRVGCTPLNTLKKYIPELIF